MVNRSAWDDTKRVTAPYLSIMQQVFVIKPTWVVASLVKNSCQSDKRLHRKVEGTDGRTDKPKKHNASGDFFIGGIKTGKKRKHGMRRTVPIIKRYETVFSLLLKFLKNSFWLAVMWYLWKNRSDWLLHSTYFFPGSTGFIENQMRVYYHLQQVLSESIPNFLRSTVIYCFLVPSPTSLHDIKRHKNRSP